MGVQASELPGGRDPGAVAPEGGGEAGALVAFLWLVRLHGVEDEAGDRGGGEDAGAHEGDDGVALQLVALVEGLLVLIDRRALVGVGEAGGRVPVLDEAVEILLARRGGGGEDASRGEGGGGEAHRHPAGGPVTAGAGLGGLRFLRVRGGRRRGLP